MSDYHWLLPVAASPINDSIGTPYKRADGSTGYMDGPDGKAITAVPPSKDTMPIHEVDMKQLLLLTMIDTASGYIYDDGSHHSLISYFRESMEKSTLKTAIELGYLVQSQIGPPDTMITLTDKGKSLVRNYEGCLG